MATSYKTPGVYIEEISKFPPSVAEVETAIPVFIGYTERAGLANAPLPTITINPGGGDVIVSEAKRIESLLEYITYFGTGPTEHLTISISETFTGGAAVYSKLVSRSITASVLTPSIHTMYYHMQLYFTNGGGPCYIISVGKTTEGSVTKNSLLAGLEMAKRYDEPTLTVFPQAAKLSTADDAYNIYSQALLQAATLQDRFVVMDCYNDDTDTLRNAASLTDNLKYGAAYHPFLRSAVSYKYDLTDESSLTITLQQDLNNDGNFTDAGEPAVTKTYASLNAEQKTLVKVEIDKLGVVLPPCAAMVGVYANVDNLRGVWKAPANVGLQMVNGLTKLVNAVDQAALNVDPVAGKSINVIRAFTGKGILVWGARTLAGNDNEWRYINVRRFCIMVEISSKLASGTFVFEPNDANTWAKVQGMLENFLTLQWRAGALQGAKPSDAFYVAVGLNRTMTAQDILEGRMIVEIGMAVVRPAEFIILRFSQMMAKS
ncbi:phage tail sheath C-terminal domain-containing protein [Asinibacterium sp. OR53]|uniref:phage tail sheath family protein n=1 Tax=Asinibacterium sp. OR53 TaxID=925409 RepID=UPI00047CB0C6|nr:phage tail sheath C-terminal domain-containing protein [Asinibacterium sp. OR53]